MTEQPVGISININLRELPKCKCQEGSLLPVMDTTQERNIPYLKGWFCPSCEMTFMFRGGNMVAEQMGGAR